MFLFAWLAPVEKPPGLVTALGVVVYAETCAVATGLGFGIMLTSGQKPAAILLTLLALTGAFVYVLMRFGQMTGFWWPLAAVVVLQAHRLLDFLFVPDPGGGRGRAVMQGALAAFLIYAAVAGAAAAFLAPRTLGPDPGSAFGIPQVVAVGFFYYALVAWSGSRAHGWLAPLFTPSRRKR